MLNIYHRGLIISSFIFPYLLGIGLSADAQIGLGEKLQAQSNATDTLTSPEIKNPPIRPTNPRPTEPTDPGPGLPGPTNPSPGIINDVYPPDPKHPSNPEHVDSPVRENIPKVNDPNKLSPNPIPAPDQSSPPNHSPQ